MVREAFRFLVVGGIGYVIDVGLFNIFMSFPDLVTAWGGPIAPKAIATLVAIGVTYWANSSWTFSSRNGGQKSFGQFGLFFIVNLGGLMIMLACLGTSHYLLGFQNLIADNVSANIIGVVLATFFRFFANRYWVFPQRKLPKQAESNQR